MSNTNKAPGVYVQEIDKPGPIAGVSTSVAAIVGPALGGPINTPTLITNWTQFVQTFGDGSGNVYFTSPTIYAPYAVRGFFDNGGAMCYFTRVSTAARAKWMLKDGQDKDVLQVIAKKEGIEGNKTTVEVTAANKVTDGKITEIKQDRRRVTLDDTTNLEPGSYVEVTQDKQTGRYVVVQVDDQNSTITLSKQLAADFVIKTDKPVTLKSLDFTLKIKGKAFENLSVDPRHSRFFARVVNSPDVDVEVKWADPPGTTEAPANLPAAQDAKLLVGGKDDALGELKPADYTAAIDTLKRVGEVNILCVPDETSKEVQKHMIQHCEAMQDRFAILDPSLDVLIATQRDNVGSDKGYAALYYPRIYVADPFGKEPVKVPPSGHIAGLYARTDSARGVHKAPANETLRGALRLEQVLTDDEQGPLNEKGINVLRFFPGRGVVVWGARTVAPGDNTQWRYVNIRRLLLYIEESIQEGTRFAVFEPNNQALWKTVQRRVADFLTRVWRDGALCGNTPEEAFQVRVDEELNPADVRALGQLVIQVVVYPVTPAEFVEFRVIQQPGGPSVEE